MLRLICLLCFEKHILTKITFPKNMHSGHSVLLCQKRLLKWLGRGRSAHGFDISLRSLVAVTMTTKSVLCRGRNDIRLFCSGRLNFCLGWEEERERGEHSCPNGWASLQFLQNGKKSPESPFLRFQGTDWSSRDARISNHFTSFQIIFFCGAVLLWDN